MMDIVDWTMHIRNNRAATLNRWDLLAESCIEPAIDLYHGELIRTQGDSILATFPSPTAALNCALSIQRGFATQPAGRPILKLRTAIHAGNCVVDRHNQIQGTAVNVAARLQEKAAPGGIVISETVAKRTRESCQESMNDLGELFLKGLNKPIRTFSLLKHPKLTYTRGRPSIAVLPFIDAESRRPDYFGDGIVENIVNALAALPELFVVSRSSTLAFRGQEIDLRKIGKILGVRYVLSGSVRRAGERVRIVTDLGDTESTEVLWSHRIDEGAIEDIFGIQDRVSQEIVAKIAPHLQQAESMRSARKPTEQFDAYDYFLRGLDLVYRLEPKPFAGALAMFEESIKRDKDYAAPHAYSALWYAIRLGQGWSPDIAADERAVRRLTDAALERDRIDPSSLALSGHFKALLSRDFRTARDLFTRAVTANPNSAVAWTRSSPTYSYMGEWEEAHRRADMGLHLSPLDRHVFFTYTALSLAAYTGGQYDDAIDWSYKAKAENPNFTANLRLLCAALAAAGRIDEATKVARQLLRVQPNFRAKRFIEHYAYRDAERRSVFLSHLRLAGLPD